MKLFKYKEAKEAEKDRAKYLAENARYEYRIEEVGLKRINFSYRSWSLGVGKS